MTRLALIRAALVMLMAGLAAPDRAAAQSEPAQSPPVQSAPIQEAPAQNQLAPAPGTDDGRYSFHRIGDGFVRLDSRTGQLAQCGQGPAGWSCKAVPDERAALESEIARLQRETAELNRHATSKR